MTTTTLDLLPDEVATSPHALPTPVVSALHALLHDEPARIQGWRDSQIVLDQALTIATQATAKTWIHGRDVGSLLIGTWEALASQLWTPDEAVCSCCAPRRDMVRPIPGDEWRHVDDEHAAEHRHVHVDGASSDCDGPHGHGHVRWPFDAADGVAEPTQRFDAVWRQAVQGLAPTYGEFTIRGVEGRVTMDRATDEGGESITVRVCDDPWCSAGEWQRDAYAEMAGY